jgi:hypothetical protein
MVRVGYGWPSNNTPTSESKSINTKLFQLFSMTTFFPVFISKFMWDHISEEETVYLSRHSSHGQLGLMVLPPSHIYFIGCGATIRPKCIMPWSAFIYSKWYKYSIMSSQTLPKISFAPTPFSIETSLFYNLCFCHMVGYWQLCKP